MSVSFVIILSTIFVSFVRSDPPSVICEYAGSTMGESYYSPIYKFNVDEVPDRCEVVVYGEFEFSDAPAGSDAAAIKSLMSAGKTVYMVFNCPEDSNEWAKIIKDPKLLDAHIAPMLAYLKKNNKIAGVIVGSLGAYDGVIPDYANQVIAIISKIKAILPSAKIGLLIEAIDSTNFDSPLDFNLTATNDIVDLYVINLWLIPYECVENLSASGGRIPRKSDTSAMSLEKLCTNIDGSLLDKSKLVVNTLDQATWSDQSGKNTKPNTYSNYCSRTIGAKEIWCPDTTQIIYDQIIFLKQTFKGIMITFMELDDTTNACGCDKFPVANTQIDAMEGKPIKCCDKIS